MASSDDKLSADAKRMGSRGFGGYLADRALGRADFSKSAAPTPAVAAPMGSESVMKRREAAAGLKNGGLVTKYKCGGIVK